MKVLLTGADGYIGSLLGPRMLQAGHEVIGVDAGYYSEGLLYRDSGAGADGPALIRKDVRRIAADDLVGFDAVVHLAELSNDPLCETRPDITRRINHLGSVRLARLARQCGIRRFVYTSSCSVYGAAGGVLRECDETRPQTTYAICKTLVERDVAQLAGDDFTPVFLRNATAYGASPRMRFDIVLNNLAGHARINRRIAMTSDGSPWRPLVHVLDICDAIICCLEAPREAIHNEVFNVGHNDENYRVRDIAEIVNGTFPGCEVTLGSLGGDRRSYRVNFDKIHRQLPGFACKWNARMGARELRDVFVRVGLDRASFESWPFTRLKALQHLIACGRLDDQFYWRA